jgi:hypothetical protein
VPWMARSAPSDRRAFSHAVASGAPASFRRLCPRCRPRDAQRPDGRYWNRKAKREEQGVDERALHTAGRRAPGLCATRSGHGVRRAFSLHSEKSQRILTVERSVACVLCATRDRGVKACSMEPTARSGGRRARYAQRRGRALASRPCAERVRRRSAPPGFRCCSNTLPLGRCASRGLPRSAARCKTSFCLSIHSSNSLL